MNSITKKCSKCGEIKDLSEFVLDKRKKDGHGASCKRCHSEYKYPQKLKEYYILHAEKIREKTRKWVADNKQKKLDYDKKYSLENKDRISANSKKWRAKNAEKLHQDRITNRDVRRLHQNNRRLRMSENGGVITKEEWEYVKNKYGNKCLKCGKSESDVTISIDHIIPVCLGGKNSIENIQPLCRSCNSSKGTKTIDYRK